MKDAKQLAEEHWAYIKQVLELHGESQQIIEKCGLHYRTAMKHGYKHGKEDAEKDG